LLLKHCVAMDDGFLKYKYISTLDLAEIIRGQKVKAQRDIGLKAAHLKLGYILKEIADYLRTHYSTVSEVIAKAAEGGQIK